MKNFIFISPTFPKTYYQFPEAWKKLGGNALCIGEDSYESLSDGLKNATTEYYQVHSLQDYDEVYRAVAWFAHKYGKIDWLESNNEFWLEQDAKLRSDFNITTGDKEVDVMRFKKKSNMKAFYHEANVPVARYHIVSTYEEGKKFIDEVGYPVIVKPNDGVGANATWKITNAEELESFYHEDLPTEYIMEEFIDGYIVSYDGITDQNNNIIFSTSHVFPDPIMNVVNGKKDIIYYSVREIPKDLENYGSKVIHAFNIKGRFFHTEYFRLTTAKKGLGEVGDLVGLEVNMRPPGGYTPDMMNYANDINVYDIYANMCMYNTVNYSSNRPYFCIYTGRRNGVNYVHSHEEIMSKYGSHVVMHEIMPEILTSAMADINYTARFETEDEMNEFANFVLEKA